MSERIGWIPPIMSLAALFLVILHLSLFEVVRGNDEGAAARIFQILMAGQIPIILFFIIKSLPKISKKTLIILTIQVTAWIAAFAPVYYLEM